MKDRIKSAFEEVKAEEALKERTKAYVYNKTKGYRKKHYHTVQWQLASTLLASLLLVSCIFTYFTPIAAISLDASSSIELKVNRFNKVIAIEGFDTIGKELATSLNIHFKNYEQVIEEILSSKQLAQSNQNNKVLDITVLCNDERKSLEMQRHIEQCNTKKSIIHCSSSNYELSEEAHHHGVSTGKYITYLELLKKYPDLNVEDITELSMHDMHEMMKETSGSNSQGNHNSHHHSKN